MRRFPQPTPTWVFLIFALARRDRYFATPSRAPKRDDCGPRSGAPMTIAGRRLSERRRRQYPVLPTSRHPTLCRARNSIPCDAASSDDPFVTRGGTGLRFAIGTTSIESADSDALALVRGATSSLRRSINQRPAGPKGLSVR